MAAVDLTGKGLLDLILPSAWVDHHNAGEPRPLHVYLQTRPRVFEDATERFAIPGVAALAVACEDLDGDGRPEVVFNNTMAGPSQHDPDFPLYVYPGAAGGRFDPQRRLELPTGGTNTYVVADLDQDGHADLVCTARDQGLRLFHGGPDGLRPDRFASLLGRGQNIHYVQVGDFDRDGWLDLLAVAYTHDCKPATMAASSVIFHGSPEGFSSERSTVLPTYTKGNARIADLDGNGWLDVIMYDVRGYLARYHGGPDGFSQECMSRIPLDIGGPGNVAAINCADLTGNGYLDLIVVVMGHYTRIDSGFHILYGGPDGYAEERGEFRRTEASSILLTVADVNRDGHPDLLVPAYSTPSSRVLPAHIYWGTDTGIDYDHPTVIDCDASCAFQVVDTNGNGWRDVLAVCHRTDLGHRVDSLLFRNGPGGLDLEQPTPLPGMGPPSEHAARLRQRLHPRAVRALPLPGLRAGRSPAGVGGLERRHAAADGSRAAAPLGRVARGAGARAVARRRRGGQHLPGTGCGGRVSRPAALDAVPGDAHIPRRLQYPVAARGDGRVCVTGVGLSRV